MVLVDDIKLFLAVGYLFERIIRLGCRIASLEYRAATLPFDELSAGVCGFRGGKIAR